MSNKRYMLAASIAFLGAIHWVQSVNAGEALENQAALSSLFVNQVSEQTLDNNRGGTLVMNDLKLDGIVSDNLAANVTTGSNIVTGDSLAGASGIPTLIQNSGNNVLIQNATIVNIQLQ